MSNKFECQKCGSSELVFTSYAKCLIPVVTKDDGSIEYLEPVVNSDDYIENTSYFYCPGCGSPVGGGLQTERELSEYLHNHDKI